MLPTPDAALRPLATSHKWAALAAYDAGKWEEAAQQLSAWQDATTSITSPQQSFSSVRGEISSSVAHSAKTGTSHVKALHSFVSVIEAADAGILQALLLQQLQRAQQPGAKAHAHPGFQLSSLAVAAH